MLSAIVFTFWPDEEIYLETCLKTLAFADEIIIIDNGASKKTIDTAKKYTKKIFATQSNDFSERHNIGAQHATGEWLFFIDADERVSRPLANEIVAAVANPQANAYSVPRVNIILGKKAEFGYSVYPERLTRLFRKDKLTGWTGKIHESSHVEGKVLELSSPLYHLTHRNIHTMIEKTINFSQLEADLRLQASHPPVVWWRLVRVTLTEFWQRIVVFGGWKMGTEGWIDGIFQAFSMFVVYARLWEMQRKPNLEQTYNNIDQKIIKGETL